MRILIVVPSQDRISGNWITASRFQRGLENHGHRVALQEAPLQAQGALRQGVIDFSPDVALLLHAYRSGKPWHEETVGLNIPYVVLLTGTDINHGLEDPRQCDIIRSVLLQATAVLVQNPLITSGFSARHPELATKLHLLPPGITLGTAPYDLRQAHALAKDVTLFLCPAGLRPVKGLLELIGMCDRAAIVKASFVLAFCGPPLDSDYSRRFLVEVEKRPWARYLGAISPQAMASAMRGADVIVNNSHTEGLANALLEAASIGIPILARRIPGNEAVVSHNRNGLLYENEPEFGIFIQQLLDPAKRRQLTCPDPERYLPDTETKELMGILQEAVRTRVGG